MEYTDKQVIHNPYLTRTTTVSHTRGTGYTPVAVATTDDYITINQGGIDPVVIDRADYAQKTFSDWMEVAGEMGLSIREYLETAMLASHAQWTNFDNASIGETAGNITVAESNLDDIIAGMVREIREANGENLLERNGGFIIWRPADFEKLQKWAASQGYATADDTLKNGIKQGFKYMGIEHYTSNKIAAGHLFGGVKKVFHCGICKSTFGKFYELEDPVVSGAQISGIGLNSRVDYAFKAWNNMVPLLFDILVS